MATVKKKPVTKSFDLSKYQVSDGTITKVIEVGEDSFDVRVKELSWFQRNTLMSKCMQIKGNAEYSFDGALYVRERLVLYSKGLNPSKEEQMVFSFISTVRMLLSMGLTYSDIKSLSDQEINIFLATEIMVREKEQSAVNARR